jgi:hypothetical protein
VSEDFSNELEEMCRAHFNEPAIFGFEIARVIGYGEDEMDAYVIARHPNGSQAAKRCGKQEIWHTCVGGYHFLDRLKGQGYVRSTGGEDWDDLVRLDSFLALNGAPRAEQFVCIIEPAKAA